MYRFDPICSRFVHCAAIFLLFAGACTTESDPSKPGYWVEKLDNKPTRVDALKELAKMGESAKSAAPAVLEWFKKEGAWQPDAAYTLGQLGDPSVAGELRAALDFQVGGGRDRPTRLKNRVNQNVARALATLKVQDSVDDLVRLADAPEAKTRDAVLRALGELGNPKAAKPMMEIAENDSEPFIRKVAIQSLGELGAAEAVPTLVKMMYFEAGDGISHYLEARFSLIQVGDAAVPKLLETLNRKNETVEKLKVGGAKLLEGTIEAKAASVLGAIGAKNAEGAMISALTTLYGKWENRNKAPISASIPGSVIELTYALGDLGTEGAMKAIVPVVKDADPRIRLAATEALTTIGNPAAFPTLLEAARSGPLESKRAALVAASQLGDSDSLEAFDALGEGELEAVVKAERVRLVAAKECGSKIDCWMGKLGSDDDRIAARAAFQLGRLGAKQAAPELLKAAEHEDVRVRMAAVLSLEDIGRADIERFRAILEESSKRIQYQPVNQQMERIIALNTGAGKTAAAPKKKANAAAGAGAAK